MKRSIRVVNYSTSTTPPPVTPSFVPFSLPYVDSQSLGRRFKIVKVTKGGNEQGDNWRREGEKGGDSWGGEGRGTEETYACPPKISPNPWTKEQNMNENQRETSDDSMGGVILGPFSIPFMFSGGTHFLGSVQLPRTEKEWHVRAK